MDPQLIWSFILAAVALTVLPGPDNMLVLTESATSGSRRGLVLTLGLVSGILVHTTLAATGLALLLRQSPLLFQGVQYAGALYLLYLAWGAYREEAVVPAEEAALPRVSPARLFARGITMNVLNPKVTLFFLAFLPHYLTENGWAPWLQWYLLGLLFMLQALVLFGGLALLAGRLEKFLRRASFYRWTRWLKVAVLFTLAVLLLLGV